MPKPGVKHVSAPGERLPVPAGCRCGGISAGGWGSIAEECEILRKEKTGNFAVWGEMTLQAISTEPAVSHNAADSTKEPDVQDAAAFRSMGS